MITNNLAQLPVSELEMHSINIGHFTKNDSADTNRLSILDIIDKKLINSLFQPIIDLQTGETFACEALSRIIGPSNFKGPEELFTAARGLQLTNRLERLCREQALIRAYDQNIQCPISVNVCPSTLLCPDHQEGEIRTLVKELFSVKDKIIIELTEKYFISDHAHFANTVEYYKQQGFRIAIDDLGSGFAGLNMIFHLEPDLVKLDRKLISYIDKVPKKKIMVESLVNCCKKINALVIAEGIERVEELNVLIGLGVDLGQGFLLGRPTEIEISCNASIKRHIQVQNSLLKTVKLNPCVSNSIESIAEYVEPIDINSPTEKAIERFKSRHSLTNIPVVQNNRPMALILKNKLFYKLGQRFGFDLFSKKNVTYVMDEALIVESDSLIDDVAKKVIKRDESSIYDAVLVTRGGKYIGIVKVHHILERITEQKISLAMQTNPLSGLPGNNMIKNEIEQRIGAEDHFAVLYLDLDHFKPFNDNFGFDQGDKVIHFLGKLIKEIVTDWDMPGFIGHVGGDDFVVVVKSESVEELCHLILNIFQREIKDFHDFESIKKGYYFSKNRQGVMQKFPLLSLSIAVIINGERKFDSYPHLISVASEIKKAVKNSTGNSYLIDQRKH